MGIEISDQRIKKYSGDLKEYSVPEGITEICDLAFSGAGDLIRLEIPDTVRSIGNYAFMNCYYLQEIRMPERVDRVGTGLFQNCWRLREIAFPEGLEILGGEMLESCHALRIVHLPDSLEQLERTAFNTCRNLREIFISPYKMDILPASIKTLAVLTYMGARAGMGGKSDGGSYPVIGDTGAADHGTAGYIDEYARKKQRLLLDLAINRKDINAVRYMLERGIADPDTLRRYLEKSAATSRVEITALLLEYGKRGETDPVLCGDPFL